MGKGIVIMKFEVVQNDITNMSVDAIVLPANEKLREGSGTSREIFSKAGRFELTRACSKIGSCRVGDAVPTRAFKLDAKYIIHAVVPKWIDGENGEYDYLSAAYLSALNVADIMECNSIAFPLLASGNNGFDLELAYEIAKESIESFDGVNLKEVTLVVYKNSAAEFVKSQGIPLVNLRGIEKIDEEKEARRMKWKLFASEGKKIATEILDKTIEETIVYLKDDKIREKIVAEGIKIAREVLIRAIVKKGNGRRK